MSNRSGENASIHALVVGAVIFLHGSGGNGRNTDYVLSRCGFKKELASVGLELICPTAKSRTYSLCGGMRENVWYDRLDLSPEAPEDPTGVDESYEQLMNIITSLMEKRGIASNRVFVGGFSMGGGMSLHFMSRFPGILAGVFTMGSFLANQSTVYECTRPLPPLIMCHGQSDDCVQYEWGFETAKRLFAESNRSGVSSSPRVTFYSFPNLGHEFDPRVLAVVKSFIMTGGINPLRHEGRIPLGDEPKHKPLDLGMIISPVQGREEGSVQVTFRVPKDRIETLVSKPVATRGAHFSFTAGSEPGTITTTFYSPKPDVTAAALQEKVQGRLLDPEPEGINACRPS